MTFGELLKLPNNELVDLLDQWIVHDPYRNIKDVMIARAYLRELNRRLTQCPPSATTNPPPSSNS